MPGYTLYIDIWLLQLACNFLFEYLLLWATATITRTQTNSSRLALGALIGTTHYLLFLLSSFGLIPFYGLFRFLPVVILVSIAMMIAAFYPLKRAQILSIAGHFYGIGFAAAGAGMASAYLFGSFGTPHFLIGTITSVLTILLVAELGWGIVHERVVNRVYQIPLEILCDGTRIKTTALVDTGNNLKDPLNRQPVIVVEQRALAGLVPSEFNTILISLDKGDLSAIDRLTTVTSWQTRIRLIPFSSIGKSNGLLLGFRPDEVKIGVQPPNQQNFLPTIAIYPHSLDPNGEYMALIPPHLVECSLKSTGIKISEGEGTNVNASSTDF